MVIQMPFVRIEWGRVYPKLKEIEDKLNLLIGEQGTPTKKVDDKIDLDLFDKKYEEKGGVKTLKVLINCSATLEEIANHFGFSKEWARRAKYSVKLLRAMKQVAYEEN